MLPPPVEIDSKRVLRHCIAARAALAELKQAGTLLPNQAMLINTIPILEAQASSEIENIVTTTDRLFRFIGDGVGGEGDPATKEALRYGTALRSGVEHLRTRPLSTATAIEVCSTIKAVEMEIRRVPGTSLRNNATGEIVYTPPVGEPLLRSLLADLERFIHNAEEFDPLIRMAVMHYQFEAIHPFTDGNGRTGRVMNLLFLVSEGLLELPVLYLSGKINRSRDTYYRLLREVTNQGHWEDWIVFMVDAVEETARWTTEKIRDIRMQMDMAAIHIKEHKPAIYSRELVEQIFIQPYCRISNLTEAGIAQRQTVSNYLKALVDIGVLREMKVGREKLFIHQQLLSLLIAEGGRSGPYQIPTSNHLRTLVRRP